MIEPDVLELIRQDWKNAPRSRKTKIIAQGAITLGCSYSCLYKQLNAGKKRKKGARKFEGLEDVVNLVFQVKKKAPSGQSEISTDQAVRILIKNGLISENMIRKVSTINRIGREMGLNQRIRRVTRFQAEYPNQLHHIDASSSKYLYVAAELPGGDYRLKLHAGKTGYKNKPVPIRLRPWIYGLVDDYSGYYVGRYIVAHGETAIDNLDFLAFAWSKNDAKPFFGLPEKLKGDLGPMMRGPDMQRFFNRLSVIIDPSIPENKESHGKIERPWRTMWQRFEKILFAQTDWKKFEITLSELNRQFMIFQHEYNEMTHRYRKDISRYQAWKEIAFRGGAVALPENALCSVAKRIERTIDAAGCFSLNNQIYEVKGLHSSKAFIYTGLFDDRMTAQDIKTGLRYEIETFAPVPVGKYTAHPDTPHQKAVKAAADLQLSETLYSSLEDKKNVTHMPVRVKETRKIEDPLDVDAYPSIYEAMQDYMSLSGDFPTGDRHAEIINLFIKNRLNRDFVRNFAYRVQDEIENRRRRING